MTNDGALENAKPGWHLWLIGVLGVFWNGFGCFDYIMTVTRNAGYMGQFPKEMQDYWYAMPIWMLAIWAIGVFGAFFGSAALLMRSAFAVQLFSAALIASLASFYVGWKDTSAPEMEGMAIMPFVILGVGALLLAYAYWQSRRGVLS